MSVHVMTEYRKATIYRPMFILALELLVDLFEAKTGQPANDARGVLKIAKERNAQR